MVSRGRCATGRGGSLEGVTRNRVFLSLLADNADSLLLLIETSQLVSVSVYNNTFVGLSLPKQQFAELWALLNFLIPEIFGSAEHFDEWFSLTDEKGQENVIKKLHTVLRPFMLRRVKNDVATSLPPKKETKLYIGLTPMQQEWYVRVLQKDAHLLNALDGPERVRLLNVLSESNLVCGAVACSDICWGQSPDMKRVVFFASPSSATA